MLNPAQLQATSLYGSGSSIGDTSIVLQSFQTIPDVNGVTSNVTMTDLGTVCYATIEPNTEREEQISFTGVTQNANGTATLTGVKSVGFLSPFTETSGLVQSHAGGVIFVVSPTSAFFNAYLNATLANVSNGPEAFMVNGQITTSVNAGTLTIAVKTLAGTDPSTTSPVYVRVGNDIRSITDATYQIVTAAGSNWLNMGGTELATQDVDLFIYFGWNTGGAGNLYMLASRYPGALKATDFYTADQIHDKSYLAIGSIGAGTDRVEVVSRVNATLSAGAGYTWSIPATSVIINRPTRDSRLLLYTPTYTWSGGTTDPGTPGNNHGYYQLRNDRCFIDHWMQVNTTASGANRTSGTVSTPFALGSTTSLRVNSCWQQVNTGATSIKDFTMFTSNAYFSLLNVVMPSLNSFGVAAAFNFNF